MKQGGYRVKAYKIAGVVYRWGREQVVEVYTDESRRKESEKC